MFVTTRGRLKSIFIPIALQINKDKTIKVNINSLLIRGVKYSN